ncbi:hypothetical protein HY572_02415 [Candidatus Micrarchaeota archaeon]|nr:hypothetical protein [Candidatus Micrarchaeota archaeon]
MADPRTPRFPRPHYTPFELESYIAACKRLGSHLWQHPKNRSVLIPLRGAFLPGFVASMDEKASVGKRQFLAFMPASQFLHGFKDTVRVFFRNFIEHRMQKGEAGDAYGFLPGERSVIHVIDEAKSGNAASHLHRHFQEVLEEKKEEEAQSVMERIGDFKPSQQKMLEEVGKRLEKEVEEQRDYMVQRLEQLSRNPEAIKLVNPNGDYTPEGIFLLKVLRATGRISDETFENLVSHRFLVEQKIGQRLGKIRVKLNIREDVSKRMGIKDIREPVSTVQELVSMFPHLKPHLAETYADIEQGHLVKEEPHVDHRQVYGNPEHQALYEGGFATLANYRLHALLQHLPDPAQFNRLNSHLRKDVIAAANKKKTRIRQELGLVDRAIRTNSLERDDQARSKFRELIKRASALNNIKMRFLTVHGINQFITTLRYSRLKDEGKTYQFDVNNLISMDHVITPLEYYSETTDRGGTIHFPSFNIVRTSHFERFLHELGFQEQAPNPEEVERQFELYTHEFHRSERFLEGQQTEALVSR